MKKMILPVWAATLGLWVGCIPSAPTPTEPLVSSVHPATCSSTISYDNVFITGTDEQKLAALGVQGYSAHPYDTLIMMLLTHEGTTHDAFDIWVNPTAYLSPTTRDSVAGKSSATDAEFRAAIKASDAAAGVQRLVTVFGEIDTPIANGVNALTEADEIANFVLNYDLDGVVISWGESAYFDAAGSGEQWLIELTTQLRSLLPSPQYTIAHQPQAPYFMGHPNYINGGYLTVHQNVGDDIDWYGIQFYNQGPTPYDSFSNFFVASIGWAEQSAVYEILNGVNEFGVSIPKEKLVIGKVASSLDASSGYIDSATFSSILAQDVSDASNYGLTAPTYRGLSIYNFVRDQNNGFPMGALCQ